jgi:hypothetical protein
MELRLSDRHLPVPLRDAVALSQPFMAVGLGAVGLAKTWRPWCAIFRCWSNPLRIRSSRWTRR